MITSTFQPPLTEPLAIVGMACRLPGADNLDEYWRLLVEGRSAIGTLPPDRWPPEIYWDPEPGQRAKTYSQLSGIIPARPGDPPGIGNWSGTGPANGSRHESPHTITASIDPAHAILLGVAQAAIADWRPSAEGLSGTRTGVYVGHSAGSPLGGEISFAERIEEALLRVTPPADVNGFEYQSISRMVAERLRRRRPARNPDGGPFTAANRAVAVIAEACRITGPQMAIEAACASSLVALAMAGTALSAGTIDTALVGGASYAKADSLILFSQARTCGTRESCPFDAAADGLVNAEGYVVLVVKTLARAAADGDRIHGVIRGIGLSSDGRGRSLWAPRAEGQALAVRRAYSHDVPLDSIQYIEAHATSTPVGDAVEVEALTQVFGALRAAVEFPAPGLPLGSVKSNIGHTLETAGLASLVKVLLALRARVIPPTINYRAPNPDIDWSRTPFRVATAVAPWPTLAVNQPARSAVNAFGVGGLNAHVVVDAPPSPSDQPLASSNSSTWEASRSREVDPTLAGSDVDHHHEPLAVIGRGVIVPGAQNLSSLRHLLRVRESQLGSPPTDRGSPDASDSFPAGYIRDYAFDWQRHRIPPLQIEQANPLQFQLLDAAEQALQESGYADRAWDRRRGAVIVGSIFGGDFSEELQIGLRVPEILAEYAELLAEQGWASRRIKTLLPKIEAGLFAKYQALFDQTGSFTSSTLASRIAKTFDLMGGAFALDAGENSGLATVQLAQQWLTTRSVDFVFCAAGTRALSPCAHRSWRRRGLLESQIPLGEGVVVLLVRRLADAVAAGDRIHAVIHDVRSVGGPKGEPPAEDPFVPLIGHLPGVANLLELTRLTLVDDSTTNLEPPLWSTLQTRFIATPLQATVEIPARQPSATTTERHESVDELQVAFAPLPTTSATDIADPNFESHDDAHSQEPTTPMSLSAPTSTCARLYRFHAATEADLRTTFKAVIEGSATDSARRQPSTNGQPVLSPLQVNLVVQPSALAETISQLLTAPLEEWTNARFQDRGVYARLSSPATRVKQAWLFPGQGAPLSNWNTQFDVQRPAATEIITRLGQVAARWEMQDWARTSSVVATDKARGNSGDPRSEQLSLLAAEMVGVSRLRAAGFEPDILAGHSFGEYTAAWAAGAITLEAAAAIVLARATAVSESFDKPGGMLSIAATAEQVEPLIGRKRDLFLSHLNAPTQTVVAGTAAAIDRFAKTIAAKGWAAVRLPVAAPYHTPLLLAAVPALRAACLQHQWEPPRISWLSAATGRFVADYHDIIDGLTRQLVEPLHWTRLVDRLLAEDTRVMVEVGPGQILTKLIRKIAQGRPVITIPLDSPRLTTDETQLRIAAALELFGQSVPATLQGQVSPNEQILLHAETTNRPSLAITGPHDAAPTNLAEPAALPSAASVSTVNDHLETVDAADPLWDFLKDILVEHTGYPRELLELDWELEADLGIDSIRQAQIFGELNEYFEFGDSAGRTSPSTARFDALPRTCREVLELLRKTPGKGDWLQSAANDKSVDRTADAAHAGPNSSAVVVPDPAGDDNYLLDLIMARTGYPRELIDWEADLEADLGIDSIAKIQLLGEVAEHYGLTLDADRSRHSLDEFRTLGMIRNLVAAQVANKPRVATPETPPSTMPITSSTDSGATKRRSSRREKRRWQDRADRWCYSSAASEAAALSVTTRPLPIPVETSPNSPTVTATATLTPSSPKAINSARTTRFRLEMQSAPLLTPGAFPAAPVFAGRALILGDSPAAKLLATRIRDAGGQVEQWRSWEDPQATVARLEQAWAEGPVPHLFLMTTRDERAETRLDQADWSAQQESLVERPYWLCQRWWQLVLRDQLQEDASLFAVTNLGGDFGVSGNIACAESGALSGLLKALIIEGWLQGHRTLPIKVLDFAADETSDGIVDAVWANWSQPSYDVEIGYRHSRREVLTAVPAPLPANCVTRAIVPRGVWVVSGGARGITGFVVEQLATKFPEVQFALLGTAPLPVIDEAVRAQAAVDRAACRASVMREARAAGRSPRQTWLDLEKALEIDATLQRLNVHSDRARYYSCALEDRQGLAAVLEQIRQQQGPITGVMHGAGIGKDARFDRKEPLMVRRCFGAKYAGAANLMSLTQSDPLQAWISFGSISGRYGANGHTDYSSANDLLAKLTAWYRTARPEVPATTIHWHAWDDIGMATKPETRLALESVGLALMPATEGMQHLLHELAAGLPLAEVVITDPVHQQRFRPKETPESTPNVSKWPLIRPVKNIPPASKSSAAAIPVQLHEYTAELSPARDPFLREHRLQGRPVVPAVIFLELLVEAAAASQRTATIDEGCLVPPQGWQIHEFQIHRGLRCPTDAPRTLLITETEPQHGDTAMIGGADVRTQSGRAFSVSSAPTGRGAKYGKPRLHASAIVRPLSFNDAAPLRQAQLPDAWQLVQYPSPDAEFYGGGPLQCLRKFALDADQRGMWGRISAPALAELAGVDRDLSGWKTPSAVLDAALFATGILAWAAVKPVVALPRSIAELSIIRLPMAAELCHVRSQYRSADERGANFDFTVYGVDGQPIIRAADYRVEWLTAIAPVPAPRVGGRPHVG